MGLLRWLLGGANRDLTLTSRSASGKAENLSIRVDGDWLELRRHAPEVDLGASTFGPAHDEKLQDAIHAAGGDASRAEITKEGEDLVIRVPRR